MLYKMKLVMYKNSVKFVLLCHNAAKIPSKFYYGNHVPSSET
jgi:hypothetical protein